MASLKQVHPGSCTEPVSLPCKTLRGARETSRVTYFTNYRVVLKSEVDIQESSPNGALGPPWDTLSTSPPALSLARSPQEHPVGSSLSKEALCHSGAYLWSWTPPSHYCLPLPGPRPPGGHRQPAASRALSPLLRLCPGWSVVRKPGAVTSFPYTLTKARSS